MINNVSYDYQKPQNTYTLDQYISCQSDSNICYHNLSFIDNRDNIDYDTYNVISDYIDELRTEFTNNVILSDKDMERYKYRPKLLCYDIYGSGELAFIILIINDMCSVKQFTKKKLRMPTRSQMADICKYIYNANKKDIARYNKED
jgi:hypothetical protein